MAVQINPSRIRKEHVERTLHSLIDDLDNNNIVIPPHQREYCWSYPQQNKFIQSVLKGYPIPSILMSGTRGSNSHTLEDGRQRITTASLFRQDKFKCENRFFSQLSEREQERFDDERVIVITFYNATHDQRIEIFDWHQNGAPLTPGERYHAHQGTPLIKFVKETLMTPGSGLHDRAAAIWGPRGDSPNVPSKDIRRKWLQTAVSLVTGLAYGPLYMNKNYQTVVENGFMTTPSFDSNKQTAVRADIIRILEIYEETQVADPVSGSTWLNKHWDMGNFTGYIAYSLSHLDRQQYNETARILGEHGNFDETAYSPNSLANEPDTWVQLKEGWVKYMVDIRKEVKANPKKKFTTILGEGHHAGLSKARNWKLERWQDGYNRIFDPTQSIDIKSDNTDDDVESDSDEL
jgi:hypothetical protein